MFASGGVLSEGYVHGGSGVCLCDGQTAGEGVPSHGGGGNALLRHMLPYLTLPHSDNRGDKQNSLEGIRVTE